MIVVLSDLHFSEAKSTKIGNKKFNRNLPPEIFKAYFLETNQFAVNNQIDKVDLVLAGDILEISRSAKWLEGEYRPYINNSDVKSGSTVEKTILDIINAISTEEYVSETLALFIDLSNLFEIDVNLHMILGNHDRLINATPRIREEVRSLFGLPGKDELFDHFIAFKDENNQPFCLIRHGHEYDPTNFSLNLKKSALIPLAIPRSAYERSCLGDITTIEFGAALSWYFVQEHGEEKILNHPEYMAIYERLMEFDDVRPTTAWLAYLLTTPGVSRKRTWTLIKPCFTNVINTLGYNHQFFKTLKESESVHPLALIILKIILGSHIFSRGIPYWMIKRIMKTVSKSIKVKSQVSWAKREELIQDDKSDCKCVVSGHTHFAEVSLISATNGDERYYINTGTWRNVIPATRNYKDFGQLEALTKVIVFDPKEKNLSDTGQDWSFHYMSGVSFGNHRHL